jgi:predicted ATPase/class 3 adenylate cyclase
MPMAKLPTGTVTFLFTDLEGSTRLWEEHPEAMKGALARHDALLRAAVGSHRGRVIKGLGDGIHAVFEAPDDALRAAADAEASLVAEAWSGTGPLRARMGVHTGMADLRDGDYFGPALNRAARLMAVAHGGQVVVSLATEELVRDALPEGLGLIELGEHRLRDVARPERVFQLTGPGLQGEFPALRSLGGTAGNVTLPATSFVGRDEDLGRVAALVAEARLVTLLGVGGVGKTRLALQYASDAAAGFDDGVWFCDLASVSDRDGVAMSVASSLGVVPRAGLSTTDALVEFLRPKQMLIVLDNCEHVLDEIAAFAAQTMVQCRRLRLLATSREALAVAGERLYPIRPLRVPDTSEGLEAAALSAPVQLFVDRVRMLRPEFCLDPGNLESVLDICRRLDGIPLALELAAARMTSMSPSEIADRLDHRFSLLAGGRRRGVARHETLRAAIDWSYDLLEDPERAALARVSVFSGGFTLDAAERVAEGPGIEVLDVLGRLVDKSLVTADDEGGTTRYRLFDTIRQYALEHIDARGETAATRDRHLAYFVDFAERAGAGLAGADQHLWQRRTVVEAENIRSAVAWAVTTAEAAAALRIVAAFAPLHASPWAERGVAVTFDLSKPALEIPGAAEDAHYPLVLTAAADFAISRGDYSDAVELAEEALRLANEPDPACWSAEMVLGRTALFDARDDPADHFERALAIARRTGDAYQRAVAQSNLAAGLSFHGADELERARAEAEAAVQLAEQTACSSVIASANFALGYILVLARDPGAVEPLRRSLAAGPASSENPGSLNMLAIHYARHGTPAQALDVLEGSLNDARYRADPSYTSSSLDLALPVFVRFGDATTAAELRGALAHGALPAVTRAGVAKQRQKSGFARLDQQLSPEERRSAEARGAAMTHDQIIAHTLERIAALRNKLAPRDADH